MTMVDIQKQIDAVERELRTADIDGAPSNVQKIGQRYPSGIDDLWQAVTTPDRMRAVCAAAIAGSRALIASTYLPRLRT